MISGRYLAAIVTGLVVAAGVSDVAAGVYPRLAAIELGPVTQISARTSVSPEQTWAHADPTDARYLIVCGTLRDPVDNLFAGYLYASDDGGISWKRTMLENSTRWVSEEACAAGYRGAAYFIAGASDYYNGEPHHETGRMHLWVSKDHGFTWKRTWTAQRWLDWNYMTAVSHPQGLDSLVVFSNAGTDKPGHWSPLRPTAVESQDGGKSFSELRAPRPSNFRYVAAWSGDGTVLADGTSLFAASTAHGKMKGPQMDSGWARQLQSVEIFAYDPQNHTLQVRAILRQTKTPIFTASISQYPSTQSNHATLFSSWVESSANKTALWLAASHDGGSHWTARPVLRARGTDFMASCASERPIDAVKTAVSPDGTLAVSWEENRSAVLFSASRDGGATFTKPVTVARIDVKALLPDEAITWNDYWLKIALDMYAGRPTHQNTSTLGLGVVARPSGIDDISLVADQAGRFHVFWVAPDGVNHVLTTRAVTVRDTNGARTQLADRIGSSTCGSQRASTLAHPVLPKLLPRPTIKGARDVTSSIAFDPTRYYYDPLTHETGVDAVVVNKGKRSIRPPLTLLAIFPHSDYGAVHVTGASGLIQGRPFWNASSAIPKTGLLPGARSRPLHFSVVISPFEPLPSNYLEGDAFSMAIRAYEGRQ